MSSASSAVLVDRSHATSVSEEPDPLTVQCPPEDPHSAGVPADSTATRRRAAHLTSQAASTRFTIVARGLQRLACPVLYAYVMHRDSFNRMMAFGLLLLSTTVLSGCEALAIPDTSSLLLPRFSGLRCLGLWQVSGRRLPPCPTSSGCSGGGQAEVSTRRWPASSGRFKYSGSITVS